MKVKKAIEIIREIYRVLKLNDIPLIIPNIEIAEKIKYTFNVFSYEDKLYK